jgi:hypothetical protein
MSGKWKQVKRQLSDFIVYKSIMGVVLKRVSKKSKRKSEEVRGYFVFKLGI